MDRTEAINVAFLAGVVITLVAAFVYVNVFYEEPEEEEEAEETGCVIVPDVPAFDAIDENAGASAAIVATVPDTQSCC